MNWKRREGGDLDLSGLTGFVRAAGEGGEIALRLEFAKVQDQVTGHTPPAAEQVVMRAAAAETLAMELLAAGARARGEQAN